MISYKDTNGDSLLGNSSPNKTAEHDASLPLCFESILSSLPSLDPNGQPFSMILRGEAADLGRLRSALAFYHGSSAQRQIQLQQAIGDINNRSALNHGDDHEGCELEQDDVGLSSHETGQCSTLREDCSLDVDCREMSGSTSQKQGKKRSHGDEGYRIGNPDENDGTSDSNSSSEEKLLFYLPSVLCNCASWQMANEHGELIVTSLRVLFISSSKFQDESISTHDVAIDGHCIALHAIDFLPSESTSDNDTDTIASLSHVYCQLSDPTIDDGHIGYPSAFSMFYPSNILEGSDKNIHEESDNENGKGEEDRNNDESSTIELYFQPMLLTDRIGSNNKNSHELCESLFRSLNQLASLNPLEDSEKGYQVGGGLFNLMSLLVGMEGSMNGFGYGDDNDEMVVRMGCTNEVENSNECEGITEIERQLMLDQLDGMLVVPPEFERSSDDECVDNCQFDDAEEEQCDEIDEGFL